MLNTVLSAHLHAGNYLRIIRSVLVRVLLFIVIAQGCFGVRGPCRFSAAFIGAEDPLYQ